MWLVKKLHCLDSSLYRHNYRMASAFYTRQLPAISTQVYSFAFAMRLFYSPFPLIFSYPPRLFFCLSSPTPAFLLIADSLLTFVMNIPIIILMGSNFSPVLGEAVWATHSRWQQQRISANVNNPNPVDLMASDYTPIHVGQWTGSYTLHSNARVFISCAAISWCLTLVYTWNWDYSQDLSSPKFMRPDGEKHFWRSLGNRKVNNYSN